MQCASCGHRNEPGSTFCAACYLTFRPAASKAPARPAMQGMAPPQPAPAAPLAEPARPAEGVDAWPGATWAVGWLAVCMLVLWTARLHEHALGSLRTGADGAGLRQDALSLVFVGAVCAALAMGALVLLAQRPKGWVLALSGGAAALVGGFLVALSVKAAAEKLARTALHDGYVVVDPWTLAFPFALLLVVTGIVVIAVAKDLPTAFALMAWTSLACVAVSLALAGSWLAEDAPRLQALASKRDRSVPFPPLLALVAALALAAWMRRAPRKRA